MSDEPHLPQGTSSFPATAWSLIQAAQSKDADQAIEALNRLIVSYWKPVYYYIRARGWPFHEAQDRTQEFFTCVIERGWLRPADPARGRFRSFLLTLLNRHLADDSLARVRRQTAFDRRVRRIGDLIDESDRAFEPSSSETPERIYMRKWAACVMETALANLRQHCVAEGRSDWFEAFAAVRLAPDPASVDSIATGLGMTRDALRHRVQVLERRLERLLRAELRDLVSDPAEIDAEFSDLSDLLGS